MKRLIIKLFLSLCLWAVLPVCAQDAVHYYLLLSAKTQKGINIPPEAL